MAENLRCNKCGQEGCYCRHSFGDLAMMLVEHFNRTDPNVVTIVPAGEAEVKPALISADISSEKQI